MGNICSSNAEPKDVYDLEDAAKKSKSMSPLSWKKVYTKVHDNNAISDSYVSKLVTFY
jgi:hypothetical protein